MTDTPGTLEERLRSRARTTNLGLSDGDLHREAADEIASLRARVEAITGALAQVAETLRRQHAASPGRASNTERVTAALGIARQAIKDTPDAQ